MKINIVDKEMEMKLFFKFFKFNINIFI